MWRKFLGYGIPIAVLGVILLIVGVSQSVDNFYGGGSGAGWLMLFGYLLLAIGGLLVQAGLIGAAVGADPRTHAYGYAPAERTYSTAGPAPLASPAVTGAGATGHRYCATCGQQNTAAAAFCAHCGASAKNPS
jgi:hypothetical protein